MTAIFPYILMTILLIRGVTLPGALDGITFYLRPDLEKIKNSSVRLFCSLEVYFVCEPLMKLYRLHL